LSSTAQLGYAKIALALLLRVIFFKNHSRRVYIRTSLRVATRPCDSVIHETPLNSSISFRPLVAADLALLHEWLNRDFVAQWYHQPDPSLEGVRAKYLPSITGADTRTRHYVTLVDERPTGMIQWYYLSDWPEYGQAIEVEEPSISIDLFIGESDMIHRGIGVEIIKTFLEEVAFPSSGTHVCYVGPESTNLAAVKCYTKAGFAPLRTLKVKGDPGLTCVMRLERC